MSEHHKAPGSFWQMVAATLMGVVVTGGSAWLVFGQKAIGREEVARMIASESPYIADRRVIGERLDANARLLERIAADVGEIKVEQARLMERIEALNSKRKP